MRKSIVTSAAIGLFVLAGASHARDAITDGKLQVKPAKDNQYQVGEYRYVGDLKDNKKITAIELLQGDKASIEQKHMVAEIAESQHLDAVIDLGGKVQPLVDPTPAAVVVPPPVDTQAPAVPAAATSGH
jgi:hypothetical protein